MTWQLENFELFLLQKGQPRDGEDDVRRFSPEQNMLLESTFTFPTTPDKKSGQANTFPLLSSSGQEVANDFT